MNETQEHEVENDFESFAHALAWVTWVAIKYSHNKLTAHERARLLKKFDSSSDTAIHVVQGRHSRHRRLWFVSGTIIHNSGGHLCWIWTLACVTHRTLRKTEKGVATTHADERYTQHLIARESVHAPGSLMHAAACLPRLCHGNFPVPCRSDSLTLKIAKYLNRRVSQ